MMPVVRRGLAAIALLSASAFAPLALAQDSAQDVVVDATTEMLSVLQNEKERLQSDPAYLDAKIDEIIVPRLDFETMTKLVVKSGWRKASPQERVELVEEFKRFMLNSYADTMTQYSEAEIAFEPFRPDSRRPEDRAVVRSVFDLPGSSPVEVDYQLRNSDGEWLIYDIVAEGVALVKSQQPVAAREIRRGGIEGFLNALKKKNGTA